MRYGLTGAHRAGKTTLAKEVARRINIDYLPISTTEVAKRHGFNPVAPMSLPQRLELQTILLDDFLKMLKDAPAQFICDRTPLDHAAYLLCELHMQSDKELDRAMIEKCLGLVNSAVEVTASTFDMIFNVAPLEIYAVDPTKPAPNKAYQQHYALVVLGLITQYQHRFSWAHIPANSIEIRATSLASLLMQRIAMLQQTRQTAAHIH